MLQTVVLIVASCSLYAISRKTNESNLRKWQKKNKLFLGLIWAHLTQIRVDKFFFKNLASLVTRYHGQLSSCTTEKTNDPILRKLSDGRDWFHRTRSNQRRATNIEILGDSVINGITPVRLSSNYKNKILNKTLWRSGSWRPRRSHPSKPHKKARRYSNTYWHKLHQKRRMFES